MPTKILNRTIIILTVLITLVAGYFISTLRFD